MENKSIHDIGLAPVHFIPLFDDFLSHTNSLVISTLKLCMTMAKGKEEEERNDESYLYVHTEEQIFQDLKSSQQVQITVVLLCSIYAAGAFFAVFALFHHGVLVSRFPASQHKIPTN